MTTVEISNANVTLIEARRPTEAETTGFAEWYKARCLLGVKGGEYTKLPYLRTSDVTNILGRSKSDGSFPGCENQAYIITADERTSLIALNTAKDAQAQADAPRIAAELESHDKHVRMMERIMYGSY